MKKLKPMLLVAMACMLALLGIPAAAKTTSKAPVCPQKQTIRITRRFDTQGKVFKQAEGHIFIKNLAKNAKIVNIKSSNPKISGEKFKGVDAISVGHEVEDKKGNYYNIKSGERAKITFTIKQNGRTYKRSCEVICVPLRNQFQYFKLGSQNYASFFNNGEEEAFKTRAKSGNAKVRIKMTEDYVLDSIYVSYSHGMKIREIKNGTTISLKNLDYIDVDYHIAKRSLYYKKPTKEYTGKLCPWSYKATLDFNGEPWKEMGW